MKQYGLFEADILLPKKDFNKWSVIACDQFTSESDYWQSVEQTVGNTPSALRMILPELYLNDRREERIADINKTMKDYLDGEVFEAFNNSMLYVERETSGGIRHGIIGLIDLADYDYHKGSHTLIRATEETVLERIPPRVQIRKDACLEMPHILLLVDDPNCTVIEPLKTEKQNLQKAYGFDLMLGGGHIDGYFLNDMQKERISTSLSALVAGQSDPLLFAVGDGNHSLATAKACYEQNPTPLNRYALVEVVNIHDASLEFEPIYRVIFNTDPEKLLAEMVDALGGEYHGEDAQEFTYYYGEQSGTISIKPTSKLPVGTLQTFLDDYCKNSSAEIDYIHGENVVKTLTKAPETIGFIFNGMQKSELFPAIQADGSLPRKTFSMGHATDKRYYIECRKIKD